MSSEMTFSVDSGQALLSHGANPWRAALRQCAGQLESSAALLLRDREGDREKDRESDRGSGRESALKLQAPTAAATERLEPALAEVLQAIERIAGLCRRHAQGWRFCHAARARG